MSSSAGPKLTPSPATRVNNACRRFASESCGGTSPAAIAALESKNNRKLVRFTASPRSRQRSDSFTVHDPLSVGREPRVQLVDALAARDHQSHGQQQRAVGGEIGFRRAPVAG